MFITRDGHKAGFHHTGVVVDGKGTWDSGIEGRRDGGRQEKERNGGMERVGAREVKGGRDKEGGRERGREGRKGSIGKEE